MRLQLLEGVLTDGANLLRTQPGVFAGLRYIFSGQG
jgi:hypothetical protein